MLILKHNLVSKDDACVTHVHYVYLQAEEEDKEIRIRKVRATHSSRGSRIIGNTLQKVGNDL